MPDQDRAGLCQLERRFARRPVQRPAPLPPAHSLRPPLNLLETFGLNLRRFTANVAEKLVSAELGRLVTQVSRTLLFRVYLVQAQLLYKLAAGVGN